MFEPINQLSQLYNTVQSAGAALHKIFGVLDTRPDSRSGRARSTSRRTARSTSIASRSRTATTSRCCTTCRCTSRRGSGSRSSARPAPGKSTLAKLIARFYDPTEGSVRVGGVDLRDATFESLRERIVVVPQEGFLFAGTLRDNVRVGRPEATDAEVDDGARASRPARTVRRVPRRPRHRGARARLTAVGGGAPAHLARARRARRPDDLVLDEATSNLDPGTEHHVERAIETLMHGRTVIVVAHRLSTAARADRIAVVYDGRLAELGTHAELVAHGGHYAELYRAWAAHQAEAPTRRRLNQYPSD